MLLESGNTCHAQCSSQVHVLFGHPSEMKMQQTCTWYVLSTECAEWRLWYTLVQAQALPFTWPNWWTLPVHLQTSRTHASHAAATKPPLFLMYAQRLINFSEGSSLQSTSTLSWLQVRILCQLESLNTTWEQSVTQLYTRFTSDKPRQSSR